MTLELAACDGMSTNAQPLNAWENRVVDAYVRLTVLEALHRDDPDSVEALFRNGVVRIDSMAVREAVDSLSTDPLRWELVFDVIAERLRELEQTPDEWWRVAQGDSNRAHEPSR